MQNGALTSVRVFLSGALSILALLGAIWLLHDGVLIPREYWVMVAIGVSGVSGIDIIAYFLKRKDGKGD
jgi:hypothetical protein